MNSDLQFDMHPDAERLNAFSEQALGEQERAQIVAHLAECGRCREVVFLAREAAAEAEMEVEQEFAVAMGAAAPSTVARKEPWYRNWRFAWIPAGALAAIVTVSTVVHTHRMELAEEQAKLAHEAATHPTEIAQALRKPTMEMQVVPRAAATQGSAGKNAKPEAPSAMPRPLKFAAAPPAGDKGATANANSVPAPVAPVLAGAASPVTDVAGYRPEPELAEGREAQEHAADANQTRTMAGAKQANEGARANEPASSGRPAMLAAPELAQANEGAGPSTGGRHKSSGVLALYKAKAAPLPSGLPELSTAAMNAELILAIDGAGGVFLSEDGGSHWVAVAKQWSGRAVVVRLEKSSGANQGAAPPPAAVFEIANDRGQDWVSTDGRNWKAK